jgi:hypothetical protein
VSNLISSQLVSIGPSNFFNTGAANQPVANFQWGDAGMACRASYAAASEDGVAGGAPHW